MGQQGPDLCSVDCGQPARVRYNELHHLVSLELKWSQNIVEDLKHVLKKIRIIRWEGRKRDRKK